MDNDLRWFLRDRTGAAHRRLDASIGQFVDAAGYGDYVRSQYRFRVPVEQAVSRVLPEGLFHAYRPSRLADALSSDLDDLRLYRPPLEPAALDLGGAGLFGVLYVLEGAGLGARVLIQRATALGFSATHGAQHLALAAGGTNWTEYLKALDDAQGLDRERAADAALATFSLAQRAFEGVAA